MKLEESFDNFVKSYDLNVENINRKFEHSYRVAELCKVMAEKLGFTAKEIELAYVIGLLHDIARFKQWQEFETFNDAKSFDHGDVGVQILKENNFIRNFVQADDYDNIIFSAIKNHNKFKIEDGLDEETLKFCKLIRDCDKIDILYIATNTYYKSDEKRELIQNEKISDACYEQMMNCELILKENRKSLLDGLLNIFSFVYDFNFDVSLKYVLEKDYINIIWNLFDFSKSEEKEKLEKIREKIEKYITK